MTITLNGTTGITNDGGYTGDGVSFADTTPSNTLVTTTGGNVGIGTSSPSVDGKGLQIKNSAGVSCLRISDNSGGTGFDLLQASGSAYVWNRDNNVMLFGTSNTERMRIDSSGNVIIGTLTPSGRLTVSGLGKNGTYIAAFGSTATGGETADGLNFIFGDGVSKGNIRWNTSVTAYNTSSDYRLKENIAPMTGALDVVQQLKPVTYNWKVDGSEGQGFIAHELAEVVPDCVTGEKDAVDAEGKPQYQGIDTSFLVATLTSAIQELKAIVDAQAERIAVLENK